MVPLGTNPRKPGDGGGEETGRKGEMTQDTSVSQLLLQELSPPERMKSAWSKRNPGCLYPNSVLTD